MHTIFIIAEIGINHNGSSDTAARLICEAAKAGIHGVKFQYRNLANAYSSSAKEIGDEILRHEINKNYLAPSVLLDLAAHAKSLGLQAGISFFDVADIRDFGAQIKQFDFFKLPSAELTNAGLIDAMLQLGKHVYLSTGCHNEQEIETALARLPQEGWTPLHCISNYPTSLQNARLGYLQHMQQRWQRPIGYSSHDDNWEVSLLALQLGATVIERHITLDKHAEGLDHSSSSTPDEFAKLAQFAESMDFILSGNAPRVPNQGERLNRQNLGRSFFAARDLAAGETLSADALVYRSPNIGLGTTEIGSYIGKPLAVAAKQGASVTRSLFTGPQALPDRVIDFARSKKLALPIRLHDLTSIQQQFPIGAFEFHLSFEEIRSVIDLSQIGKGNRYSIHLPDYINSTQLMDPFSADADQRAASLDILERTVSLAEQLQQRTGTEVPVVGSFSVVHDSLETFHAQHAALLAPFGARGVSVMPQWLPPIAWYFGGSVKLHAMNQLQDMELLRQHNMPVCMDICHLIMGRNFFGFSTDLILDTLQPNIRHIHIADAAGIDGEGMAFGSGEPENIELIGHAFDYDCLKVIEVWQGHLDNGTGFHTALCKLAELYDR